MLVCHGSNVGGYTSFVKDHKLHYVHNYVGAQEFPIESGENVPEGKSQLRYEFEPAGKPDIAKGKDRPGRGQLQSGIRPEMRSPICSVRATVRFAGVCRTPRLVRCALHVCYNHRSTLGDCQLRSFPFCGEIRLRLSFAPVIPSQDVIRRMLAGRRQLSSEPGYGRRHDRWEKPSGHVVWLLRCSVRSPVSEKAISEIGSVTKLFTALLLADMANRGDAKLDEPVGDLLPPGTRVPSRNGREITLCDLASHHSGFPRRPTNLTPNDPADPYAHYTADHLYEFLANYELTRTPGDTYEYSNLGVGLLGHALVLRAGNTRTRILAPLGMDDTVITIPHRLVDRVAIARDDTLDPVPAWSLGILGGAGAFRSSPSDLLLFLDALCDRDSPIASMVSPLIAARAQGGMELGPPHPDGGIANSHWGGTGGSRCFVRCIPAWKRGVVVLSNAGIDAIVDLGVHVLDNRFATHWYRTETAVDPRTFARLVGRYQAGPNTVFEVTTRDNRLYVRLSGQNDLRAFPMSEWHFFYKIVNAQLTFEPGSNGRAARLVLHQNGSDQIAERIE
jgi:serine-type D-Ala-D-Ala carboxypeptidase/endopeptidase